jgi:hypothetical protein
VNLKYIRAVKSITILISNIKSQVKPAIWPDYTGCHNYVPIGARYSVKMFQPYDLILR